MVTSKSVTVSRYSRSGRKSSSVNCLSVNGNRSNYYCITHKRFRQRSFLFKYIFNVGFSKAHGIPIWKTQHNALSCYIQWRPCRYYMQRELRRKKRFRYRGVTVIASAAMIPPDHVLVSRSNGYGLRRNCSG